MIFKLYVYLRSWVSLDGMQNVTNHSNLITNEWNHLTEGCGRRKCADLSNFGKGIYTTEVKKYCQHCALVDKCIIGYESTVLILLSVYTGIAQLNKWQVVGDRFLTVGVGGYR